MGNINIGDLICAEGDFGIVIDIVNYYYVVINGNGIREVWNKSYCNLVKTLDKIIQEC